MLAVGINWNRGIYEQWWKYVFPLLQYSGRKGLQKSNLSNWPQKTPDNQQSLYSILTRRSRRRRLLRLVKPAKFQFAKLAQKRTGQPTIPLLRLERPPKIQCIELARGKNRNSDNFPTPILRSEGPPQVQFIELAQKNTGQPTIPLLRLEGPPKFQFIEQSQK